VVSEQPGEPAPDFLIPMTRLHLEPLPPVTPPGPAPAALPVQPPPAPPEPPPTAIPVVQSHHGKLPLVIEAVGSALALGLCAAGQFAGLALGGGLIGILPGSVVGLLASTTAWSLARYDLARMDAGAMDATGRPWALRGRFAGLVFAGAWGVVLYTVSVFQVGFFVARATG
jgi:hypothetical protein